MEALKVGIREFREKLASYLLESDVPVAITRHGDTVGYYIPARHKRAETERAALKEAASHLHQVLAAEGISEDEILGRQYPVACGLRPTGPTDSGSLRGPSQLLHMSPA